ncbi:glutathione S-transferase family protein [Solirhodobacter olei]|uniref:glutathione S-transferase family protein n=1 Tax=Solirhodobacter olei TaxID=2493082 RepID=UPI000FD6C710|nr:glutathione S-transferase family protein [Solirhodobacter olei]
MVTLYGVARSRASRPLWMLAEIGMDYLHVPVIQAYRLDQPKAADAPLNTASAEYLEINPQGQVPCLVDGDLVLTESLGIDLYLARRYGGLLGPQTDAESALMIQWALHAVTGIEGPALEITFIQRDGGDATPEGQAVIAVAAEKLRRPFRRLDAHLAKHDWMVGDRFTVADINSAECVRYAEGHPTLLSEFPHLKAWYERCHARPGFRKMWEMREAEPA